MQIGDAGDPLSVCIGVTRIKDQTGLFVYRPFDAAPFQKGAKSGRELLLRQWHGENIDWAALRAKYREERPCNECKEQKPAAGFTRGKWKRSDGARVSRNASNVMRARGSHGNAWHATHVDAARFRRHTTVPGVCQQGARFVNMQRLQRQEADRMLSKMDLAA